MVDAIKLCRPSSVIGFLTFLERVAPNSDGFLFKVVFEVVGIDLICSYPIADAFRDRLRNECPFLIV